MDQDVIQPSIEGYDMQKTYIKITNYLQLDNDI